MRNGKAGSWHSSPVRAAIRRCSLAILGVAIFSGVINILALTGSFYMLQVYDRVLTSRSIPTLVGLTVLMAGLYAANGMLDFLRVRVMSRVGVRIDNELRENAFAAVQTMPQFPQWFSFSTTSTQAPSQKRSVPEHSHIPATQLRPAVQGLLQVPQCVLLV